MKIKKVNRMLFLLFKEYNNKILQNKENIIKKLSKELQKFS